MPPQPQRQRRCGATIDLTVLAPDGTAARNTPDAVVTSASTVGLPRESMTSRPTMEMMLGEAGAATDAKARARVAATLPVAKPAALRATAATVPRIEPAIPRD